VPDEAVVVELDRFNDSVVGDFDCYLISGGKLVCVSAKPRFKVGYL
jgi:hypothetical protein